MSELKIPHEFYCVRYQGNVTIQNKLGVTYICVVCSNHPDMRQ